MTDPVLLEKATGKRELLRLRYRNTSRVLYAGVTNDAEILRFVPRCAQDKLRMTIRAAGSAMFERHSGATAAVQSASRQRSEFAV
jgi:hypothetical protein